MIHDHHRQPAGDAAPAAVTQHPPGTATAARTANDAVAAAAAGVTAVVVTFNPDTALLAELLARTRPQVERIELIDNGSAEATLAAIRALCTDDTVRLTALGENRGIGGAQNAGIALARQQGARYVLLLDHDSLPAEQMVARLRAAIEEQPATSHPVAASGPRYADQRHSENTSPFVRQVGTRRVRCECQHPRQRLEVEHLIASGCLIPIAILDAIGDMNEGLFIDYVDIEWCLRATHAGYCVLGVCDAHMEHHLGDTPIQFRGKPLALHSALRNYYIFRNAWLLYRMPHVTFAWKLVDFKALSVRFVVNILTQKPLWPCLRMTILGTLDGIRGKTGPFSHKP